MPPSSSRKKKKGGNSKKPKPKPIDDDEEKALAEAFAASTMGQAIGLTNEILAEAASLVPAGADNPPCDKCSKPFGGTMQCAQCESVFYCGKECQASHWTFKHKVECARLKQQNEAMAKRVLESFDCFPWRSLDLTGTYKAAVRLGLHDKIREAFELERTSIVDRCRREEKVICYTMRVMLVLFRGQRNEGKNPVIEFSVMDGHRIKGYVRSHPDAFDTWLQASVQLLHAVLDRTTLLRNPDNHRDILEAATQVWFGWHVVFASPVASRAILMPSPSTEDGTRNIDVGESAAATAANQLRKTIEDRARRIVTTLRDAIYLIDGVSDSQVDPVAPAFSSVSLTAATIQLRLDEFRIGVNAEAILNLKGMHKLNYQLHILPMAKRSIEKGSGVNAQDTGAIMARTHGLG